MTRQIRRTLITALSITLITLAMMLPATSAPVVAASPDFLFSLNMKAEYWNYPSYLIRGGDPGPDYPMASYSGWFWAENTLSVISRNGFQGNVNLAALNLPSGINSELPSSVYVPKGKGVTIVVHLRATPGAALGDVSGVTLRGTSGNLVHTANLPTFTVVDERPPLPN
jgi:hypothetical protein